MSVAQNWTCITLQNSIFLKFTDAVGRTPGSQRGQNRRPVGRCKNPSSETCLFPACDNEAFLNSECYRKYTCKTDLRSPCLIYYEDQSGRAMSKQHCPTTTCEVEGAGDGRVTAAATRTERQLSREFMRRLRLRTRSKNRQPVTRSNWLRYLAIFGSAKHIDACLYPVERCTLLFCCKDELWITFFYIIKYLFSL